jgi:hypothetical protein
MMQHGTLLVRYWADLTAASPAADNARGRFFSDPRLTLPHPALMGQRRALSTLCIDAVGLTFLVVMPSVQHQKL